MLSDRSNLIYGNIALRAFGYELELKKEYHTDYNENFPYERSPYKGILQGITINFEKMRLKQNHSLEISVTEKIQNWFYIQNNSDNSQELLTPTMGYAFGGSRSDSKYKNLLLHNEDCSSSLNKWLKLKNDYTTADFFLFHNLYSKNLMNSKDEINHNLKLNDLELNNFSLKIAELKQVIQPKYTAPSSGDIVVLRSYDKTGKVLGGHCGIVTDYNPDTITYEYLSYNRNLDHVNQYGDYMPFEGLGFSSQKYNIEQQINDICNDRMITQVFFEVL